MMNKTLIFYRLYFKFQSCKSFQEKLAPVGGCDFEETRKTKLEIVLLMSDKSQVVVEKSSIYAVCRPQNFQVSLYLVDVDFY